MKRILTVQPSPVPTPLMTTPRNLAAGAYWNGLTIPEVPSADWPASVILDHAIDRIIRDCLSSGRSLHEAVSRISELASTIVPQITEAELDRRVHAQAIANT